MPKKAGNNAPVTTGDLNKLTKKIESLTTTSPKRSRNARKRANRKKGTSNDSSMNFKPSGDMVMSKASDTGLRRLRMTPRTGLSDSGIAFLKCAFAPPDFQASHVAGVPDDFRGPSMTRKHRYVASYTAAANLDVYILLLPIPGYAYFITTIAAGTTVPQTQTWTGVPYSDYQSMFGSTTNSASNTVTKFRFVSNHIEVIPTVNQMTWTGSIQTWKIPTSVQLRQSGANTSDLLSISGLDGVNSNLSNQYSGPFIMGVYTACYSSNATFDFVPILEDVNAIPTTLVANTDFGQILSPAISSVSLGIPGHDNGFESMLVKFSGVSSAETCIIKTWACVEYQVSPTSALYEFQSLSMSDKTAMELYREIITNLPVGVPFEDNDSFWSRVLQIIHNISGTTANIPGTIGMASRGINLLSGAALPFLR